MVPFECVLFTFSSLVPRNGMEIKTMTNGIKELCRESEWMRVFKIAGKEEYVYESKFLVDGLHVPPSAIKSRWAALSLEEKVEFSTAFGSQPPRDDSDQTILQFLMESGPEEVWRNIAILMLFHPRPSEALAFLIERIEKGKGAKANYYQAVELLRGLRAVPALRQDFDEYQRMLSSSLEKASASIWSEYLQCAKSLFSLTKDEFFLDALRHSKQASPSELDSYLTHLLEEAERTKGKPETNDIFSDS
jgi:hypothetical protein